MLPMRDTFSRNAAILASVTALGAAVGYQIWRNSKLKISGAFKDVGRVKKIYIYPIKSLPGFEVDSAYVTKTGLSYGPVHDRSFLLLSENGQMVTLRQEPTLALLKLCLKDGYICIDGEGMSTLKIKPKTAVEDGDIVRACRLFGQDITGIDCGEEVSEWFGKFLGKSGFCLLQFVPTLKPREILNNLLKIFSPGQIVYHDDSTYLVLSEASISDLNERLTEKISYKNFRPNFLLTDCEPYAEDNMKFANVGEATLLFTTQCPRCVLTTVNPETGVRTDKEPLTTLRTYRLAPTEELRKQYKNAPLFGTYMGVRKEGKVSMGDIISAVPVS